MHKRNSKGEGPYHWRSLAEAAHRLAKSEPALRRMIQRNVKRGPKGILEAQFNHIVARKFGGRWRVSLSEVWE